ncbi:hypothetical protein N5580_04055 [Pantoea piersonii]|uniref:Uncharacterized protein n=1 Tax=Pantoea piersonii TaxID=2364647 RepID=A0AAJ5QJN6_9GAMM|nr:hypothetical protein [Pantoea piersonii]WBG91737.1 hypothetical protein N5580_04055 [Pantoea piersonii]
MIKIPFFERIKNTYIQVIQAMSIKLLDRDDLMVDYDSNLDSLFLSDMERLSAATELLRKAKESDDKITMQAALVYIRSSSTRLSGFFENITDDADLFLKKNDWPDIPDDYQVPEDYNYPYS